MHNIFVIVRIISFARHTFVYIHPDARGNESHENELIGKHSVEQKVQYLTIALSQIYCIIDYHLSLKVVFKTLKYTFRVYNRK